MQNPFNQCEIGLREFRKDTFSFLYTLVRKSVTSAEKLNLGKSVQFFLILLNKIHVIIQTAYSAI